MKKKINNRFIDGTSVIRAEDFNEMIDAINEITWKIDYLYYKEHDPKKAAEIMAYMLGNKQDE